MRLLKTVSILFPLTAVILATMSCGSGAGTQLRVVNALSNIQNNNPLDVYVNNSLINSTPLSYSSVFPTQPNSGPATYTGVPGGSVSIDVYNSPQSTSPPQNPIFTNPVTENLTNGDQYTLVLAGSYNDVSNLPTAYLFTDVNIAPAAGNIVLHIINASVHTPQGGFSIYIYQSSGGLPATPQITGLLIGKLATFSPAWVASTSYAVTIAYPSGAQFYTYYLPSPSNQQITTLVIQDLQSAENVEDQPIVMTDLN
jgi:hypothetical protein